MPTWRCPHCGTPQAEASRCWVCKRSSTSCATCRHFRRSVAANLGYCGLDPRRIPLRGDELRGCWEAPPLQAAPGPPPATAPEAPVVTLAATRRPIEFVPVGSDAAPPASAPRRRRGSRIHPASDPTAGAGSVGLFADLDR